MNELTTKGDTMTDQTKQDYVLRSNTGKYHAGRGNASSCNGRSGKFVRASSVDVERANESSFCKKCFWKGKETAMHYINND